MSQVDEPIPSYKLEVISFN